MSDMKFWDKVKRPPTSALKQIKGGRLQGMTDINPQWRLEAMTEHFGQIGLGWYYEIQKFWTESGYGGELMAFVHIHLYTKNDEKWTMPIVGIGGSSLVAKESSGLRANDEAYKMALTDALSVAMKQLGVGSDIYMGRYDGSKYKDEPVIKPISNQPNAPVGNIESSKSPLAGALDSFNPEEIEKLKDIVAEIVHYGSKALWDDAFIVYDNIPNNDEKTAVWALLQPNSTIRSKLKIVIEEKRKATK